MSRLRDQSRLSVDGQDIIPFTADAPSVPGTIGQALRDVVGVNAFDGMIPNATTTLAKAFNLAVLQANVNHAAARNVPLIIPRRADGQYRVNGSATVPDGGIDIASDNGSIFSTADAPLFILTGRCEYRRIGGFRVFFELGAPPTAACAIKFASTDNTKYTQYNLFSIVSYGALATYINDSVPRPTFFGLESNVSWNWFVNDANFFLNNVSRNVYLFNRGSGTGNTYVGTKGILTSTASDAGASAFFRFEGGGHVVGDIVINGYHLGADEAADCAVFEVMPGAAYRTNISLSGQTDAGVVQVFRIYDQLFTDLSHDGLIGGGAIVGIDAPQRTMRICDRGVGEWKASANWSTNGTGLTSVDIARVKLKGGSYGDVGGVTITLNVNGLVGGVNFGTAEIKVPIRLDAADIETAVADAPTVISAGPAGIFGASVSISGLTATISLTMTPSGTGSNGHVNITGSGRNFSLERL